MSFRIINMHEGKARFTADYKNAYIELAYRMWSRNYIKPKWY